jgi:hypothetical protein
MHLSSKASEGVKKKFGRREVMGKRKEARRERFTKERSNGGHAQIQLEKN